MPDKITQEEIIELFGAELPIEAAKLLWTPNDFSTDEVRDRLRKMAAKQTPDDEAIVEAMARAMCEAHGFDPDHVTSLRCVGLPGLDERGEPRERIEANDEPRWFSWRKEARVQLAAHRAMIKAEREQWE